MGNYKYYVVFNGRKKGIFNSWEECKENIAGYKDAFYKGYSTLFEAERAYGTETKKTPKEIPVWNSISVDAACSGNPGRMEYQGVYSKTKQVLFSYSCKYGTNNIGEFLAIVHGLSYLQKHNLNVPLYTDSQNAILWVKQLKCRTKLQINNKTEELFNYISRAEQWLKDNHKDIKTPILKWQTELWGEIPADFGRK